MTHIAIALNYANLKLVKSLVKTIIEFDIYTPNPLASMHEANVAEWIAVIDLESPSLILVYYKDFEEHYEGRYSSGVFSKVTPK
jgi:hypothetical protein